MCKVLIIQFSEWHILCKWMGVGPTLWQFKSIFMAASLHMVNKGVVPVLKQYFTDLFYLVSKFDGSKTDHWHHQ